MCGWRLFLQVAGICVSGLLTAASVHAEVPPTLCPPDACEYLVNGFSGTYPSERERADGHWQCYDQESKISIACTFIRGDDIRKYSDVYRRGSSSSSARFDFCRSSCPDRMSDQCWRICCNQVGGTFSQNPNASCSGLSE